MIFSLLLVLIYVFIAADNNLCFITADTDLRFRLFTSNRNILISFLSFDFFWGSYLFLVLSEFYSVFTFKSQAWSSLMMKAQLSSETSVTTRPSQVATLQTTWIFRSIALRTSNSRTLHNTFVKEWLGSHTGCNGYKWFVSESHTGCNGYVGFVIESHPDCHGNVWFAINPHRGCHGYKWFVTESHSVYFHAWFVTESHPVYFHAWFVSESHTGCHVYAWFVTETYAACHCYVWFVNESHPVC